MRHWDSETPNLDLQQHGNYGKAVSTSKMYELELAIEHHLEEFNLFTLGFQEKLTFATVLKNFFPWSFASAFSLSEGCRSPLGPCRLLDSAI